MSSKENFISQLNTARYEHKKWLNNIKVLVSGMQMDKESIPLNEMDSPFGMWLYRDAMLLSTHSSKAVLEEISTLYSQCYEAYHKIYALVFRGKSEGFFGLFANNKLTHSDLLLAQRYYEELVVVSDNLLKRLRLFESQVHAAGSEKFDHLYPHEEVATAQQKVPEEAVAVPQKGQRYYRGSLIEE